ncbi:14 kDa proline-rich protein DC2.15-like [Impatiens glandulifera]|uniref:14 kDa proline-rich protein DC2.15-like n=1 Tax=Impatiens glandulifera TaxID=253017 RepID=UPI001FB0BC53|nr:14 kDa proline-rich protein DC2.15-like [Impatiens glandulifera]
MASKAFATSSMFLFLNLLFLINLVSSEYVACPPPPKPVSCPPPPPPKPVSCPPPPFMKPKPTTPSGKNKCPNDTLKFGICEDALKGLLHLKVGIPPKTPCCSLIEGLDDFEAAVCLCTAIKANVLGNNLNVPVSLTLLLNYCGKGVPSGFQCS